MEGKQKASKKRKEMEEPIVNQRFFANISTDLMRHFLSFLDWKTLKDFSHLSKDCRKTILHFGLKFKLNEECSLLFAKGKEWRNNGKTGQKLYLLYISLQS